MGLLVRTLAGTMKSKLKGEEHGLRSTYMDKIRLYVLGNERDPKP